mmetsp:Transcript_3810/g.8252  ORF Transcript_3810/g.8252 Transcript_3810/m.8252 type:complete len:228 (+) Transcript_3810:81-764(+)
MSFFDAEYNPNPLSGVFVALALLGLLDLCVFRHTSARWYWLHSLCNLVVVAYSLGDCLRAADNPGSCCVGRASSDTPAHQIVALHMYHLMAFKCTKDEWVHHIIFVSIIGGVGLYFAAGPLVNMVAFFMCGLPGGLDYMMLALVKHDVLSKLSEKAWNSRINVWIRSPGLLLCAFCIFQAVRHGPNSSCQRYPLVAVFVALLCYVNGQYYMQKVTGNTYRKHTSFSS